MLKNICAATLLLLWCVPACAAPAGAGNPATAHILSLPSPPKIDGDGNDWPATAVQNLSGPDGKASFQIAGDAANFYALVKVADKSPLKNNATRPEENLKGGDAVALYFGGAPGSQQRVLIAERDKQTEVYIYRPQSKTKKPYTFASPVGTVTFDYVAPLPEARAKFKVDKDGYTLEIAIPWKSLDMAAMPISFPFEVQVIFSDPAGTTNASMAWWHAKGGPGDTVEDLPTEAKLYPETWGVASFAANVEAPKAANGTAVAGVPIRLELPRAGRLSLVVMDSAGWIVRELLLAEKREAGAQTVEWDGRDRYGEPLPPGPYQWKALLFDGMAAKFMGSVGNSGRPPYRTPDGLGSMGGQHGIPTALAADEGGVYMASGAEEGQPAMRKINVRSGEALWKRSVGGFGSALAIAAGDGMACFLNRVRGKSGQTVDLVRIDPQTGRDVKMGEDKKALARVTVNVPLPDNSKKVEAEEEPVERFDNLPVGGMVIAGKRAYWSVPAQNRIGGVNLETGAILPDISISAPLGIAHFDSENLLVCSGAQIVKLNLASAQGTPLIRGLKAPRAVARDVSGNLYVSELGDQQIKKFSSDGRPLASWGRAGGKPPTMAPYDPLAFDNVTALAVGPDGNLWLCEASALPKRFVKLSGDGKWLEDFYGPVAYNTFGPDLDDASVVYYNPGGNQGGAQIIETKLDYAQYVANPKAPASGWRITGIYDLARGADGQTINPVMADVARTGYGHYFAFTGANGKKYLFRPSKHNRARAPSGAGLWLWENAKWVPAAFLSRDEKQQASWADRNGDGLMQDDERFTGLPTREFAWIGRDLTLQGFDGILTPAATDARGVPNYQNGHFAPYLKAGEPNYHEGWTFVSHAAKGAVYYVANAGADRHLSFWDRASENRLIKVENGMVQWLVGQHQPKGGFAAFSTVSGVAGVVDDIVIAHNVEPATYLAFTSDGFTLGNVLADENGQHASVGPHIVNIESFTGFFVKDAKTGKNLLFSVSSGDDRILEITGPGQTTRLKGEVTLDTSRPRRLETANTTEIPYQTWVGNNPTSLRVDGEGHEWLSEARGLPLMDGGTVIGDVRLRRDAGHLHVLADVLDATPLESGEGIELRLAPQDSSAQGGVESRLFLSAGRDAKGNWKGTATLQNGGTEVPTTGSKVAVALRWRNLGYRLEAQIPLTLLPAVSAPREQPIRRIVKDERTGKMSSVQSATATLPDLHGPLRLGAAVIRHQNGAAQRVAWPTTGFGTASTP